MDDSLYTFFKREVYPYLNKVLDILQARNIELRYCFDADVTSIPNPDNEIDSFRIYTTLKEGQPLIVIKKGLMMYLFDTLKIFLSNNEVFKNIGSCNKLIQIKTFKTPNYAILHGSQAILNDLEDFGFDNHRGNLFMYLYFLMVRFLMLHELFHVLHGHIDLVSKELDKLTTLDKQTLELNADCMAVSFLLDELIVNLTNDNWNNPYPLYKGEETLDSLIFCVFFIFRILPGESITTIETLKESIHLTKTLRAEIAVRTIENRLKLNYPEIKFDFYKATTENINEVEFGIFSVSEDEYNPLDYLLAYGAEAGDYSDQIRDNWERIKSMLYKYAKIPLSP